MPSLTIPSSAKPTQPAEKSSVGEGLSWADATPVRNGARRIAAARKAMRVAQNGVRLIRLSPLDGFPIRNVPFQRRSAQPPPWTSLVRSTRMGECQTPFCASRPARAASRYWPPRSSPGGASSGRVTGDRPSGVEGWTPWPGSRTHDCANRRWGTLPGRGGPCRSGHSDIRTTAEISRSSPHLAAVGTTSVTQMSPSSSRQTTYRYRASALKSYPRRPRRPSSLLSREVAPSASDSLQIP